MPTKITNRNGEIDLSSCKLKEVSLREIVVLRNFRDLDISNHSIVTLNTSFRKLSPIVEQNFSTYRHCNLPNNFDNSNSHYRSKRNISAIIGMAEKAAGKKEQQQQKTKKVKQQEKKKKNKVNKNKNYTYNSTIHNSNSNSNFNNVNRTSKRKSGSANKSFIGVFFTRAAFILLGIGFIYIVDYDQFVKIKEGADYCVNKTLSVLPPEVVTKGKEAVEYIRPVTEIALNRVNVLLNETSTFFNSNPLVKDHWTNIREISLICSARLVDYMRTLYLQTIGYCNDVKKKFFQ